jgi:hypothetical protein
LHRRKRASMRFLEFFAANIRNLSFARQPRDELGRFLGGRQPKS